MTQEKAKKLQIGEIKLKGGASTISAESKTKVKDAEKRKKSANETLEEAWERILAMKNSETEQRRLISVKQAMEKGEIGREPVPEGKRQGKFSKAEALRLFKALEHRQIQQRLSEMVDNTPDNYVLITKEKDLEYALNILKREEIVVFDVETTGVDVYSDIIVGHVLSATKANIHLYIPTNHDDPSPQLDRNYVADRLRPLYENPNIGFIAHNSKFDMQILRNNFGIKVANLVWDTQEAMILLNENESSYALKPLATKYLRDESYTYGQLFGDKGFNEIDLETALAYAAKDGDLTYRLYEFQRKHMAEHGNILQYFETVEMPLLSIVSEMELRGYDIDEKYARKYAEELRKKAEEAHARVRNEFGEDVNLNSPAQLKKAIEKHVGKKVKNTNAKDTLKPLSKKYPIIADLLTFRGINKLLTTYYDVLPDLINEKTNRIHTRLHQNGADTGRFSAGGGGSFNIQNQPKDSRKMFIAPEGYYILNADFSSQEVRIIASESQEEVMLDAIHNGKDAYAMMGSEFFNKPYEECYKLPSGEDTEIRKQMKTVVLSSMYGATKYGLSQSLNISVNEAEEFRLSFFEKYKRIDKFIKDTQNFARKHGYVWIGDRFRKRRLPEATQKEGFIPYGKWDDLKYEEVKIKNGIIRKTMRQAPNARIQGLAAIQTKITMVELDKFLNKRGWEWFAPIHDEVVIYVTEDINAEDVAEIERIMTQSYLLNGVENGTDIEIQRRWSDSITIEDFLAGKEVPGL